jgi:aspartyl-tRNA(Asn)/glutamyl-tRNA(Gln) amidotransferase subunit C
MATQFTKEQIEHIAKLARLKLTPQEMEKMPGQLTSILEWMNVLNEVDTSTVEPTAQVTGLTNALRDDTVRASDATPDDLLGCSGLPLEEHQIRSPHAHG